MQKKTAMTARIHTGGNAGAEAQLITPQRSAAMHVEALQLAGPPLRVPASDVLARHRSSSFNELTNSSSASAVSASLVEARVGSSQVPIEPLPGNFSETSVLSSGASWGMLR